MLSMRIDDLHIHENWLGLQFYDKFNIRHNIAELLEYLWSVPSHHNAWKKVLGTMHSPMP